MSLSEDTFSPRLDGIETQWSLVQQAHEGSIHSGTDARNALVLRYSTAIRAYVKAITRNDEEAHEIAQDAVVRLLKGDFAGADSQRGRFRDLLKVAIRNMVRNHWSKQKRRRAVDFDVDLMEESQDQLEDDDWLRSWRKNVLDLAWSRLEDYQRQHTGSVAYTVLRLRTEHPDLDSTQLAAKLSDQVGRAVKPDTVRQQLRRARMRFAEMVVEEIAHGLETADPARIQDELICLGIYEHIKDVLPDSWRHDGG